MIFVGVIPARYESSRFPGKPLVDIGGKPMIQRVYEQAKKVLDIVIVATDDQRIYDCVQSFGGEVIMTSKSHTCGTDRVYEAFQVYCKGLQQSELDKMVVVNIQGDEPFIQPDQIRALMSCFPTEIATLVHPFSEKDTLADLQNPNYVKVAIAHDNNEQEPLTMGRAIYFSRNIIPYLRGVEQNDWIQQGQHYRHIGMYAYRADILQKITQLKPSMLEKLECLEQLRWLGNGLTIRVAVTHHASIGVDTPDDLQYAIQYLSTLITQ